VNPITICVLVFGCVFGGALIGLALRSRLPEHHLASDSRDVVKLGIGLIGTMAALVLGLLVSSAKGSYDTQRSELTQISANLILLDRLLVHYGPEADGARKLLREVAIGTLHQLWPEENTAAEAPETKVGDAYFDKIQELAPRNDAERALQSQAESMSINLGQLRWLLFEQSGSAISMPMLVVLVFWLAIIFAGFGALAPRNSTVVVTLFLCALAVSGAIFLILELDHPFEGLIRLSSDPVRAAIAHLSK
jgi:4-amino-4-deoxy-L-arabinose transferase-like glycosyltransferase